MQRNLDVPKNTDPLDFLKTLGFEIIDAWIIMHESCLKKLVEARGVDIVPIPNKGSTALVWTDVEETGEARRMF